MKRLLLIFLTIPLISFSQDNDFLTKLFLDSVQIKNQDFKLKLAGVINTKAQRIYEDDGYYSSDHKYLSEVLFLEELRVSQQFKSEVFLGDARGGDFGDACSWNWNGPNLNLKMVSPYSLDYFPTFSFLKGKLLTIIDIDSASKDYLFSVSQSEGYDNYGHKTLKFNLTDDNERGYTIRTIIMNEQCYIIFTKSEMSELGFDTEFVDQSKFKVDCRGESEYVESHYNNDREYVRGYTITKDCYCICSANYLSLYRKQTKYMEGTYNLDQDDLIYLFRLEKQEQEEF